LVSLLLFVLGQLGQLAGGGKIHIYTAPHKCSIEIISYAYMVADPGLVFCKVAGSFLLRTALFSYQKLYSAGQL